MDYLHRNGFNNKPLIDQLNHNQKKDLEKSLYDRLGDSPLDTLIVETLAYLKSKMSLEKFYYLLKTQPDAITKLIIAVSIYEIGMDSEMVPISIALVREVDNEHDKYYVYNLSPAFHYLAKIEDPRVTMLLKEYLNHKEYLVSYNAREALARSQNKI